MSGGSCFVVETVQNAVLLALCQQLLHGPRAALPMWKTHLVTGKFLKYSDKGKEQERMVEVIGREIFCSA